MPTVPGTLATTNLDPASTATASGSTVAFATGQVAQWTVTPTTPGDHWLRFNADAPFGARFIVRVDGAQQYAQTLFSDDEDETMPYHSRVETLVTCPAGSVTRLDPSPAANRCEVRFVNTDANVRVAVASVSPATGPAPTITVGAAPGYLTDREVLEADYGTHPPERADTNTAFYARPMGATAVVVRVIQYHTA